MPELRDSTSAYRTGGQAATKSVDSQHPLCASNSIQKPHAHRRAPPSNAGLPVPTCDHKPHPLTPSPNPPGTIPHGTTRSLPPCKIPASQSRRRAAPPLQPVPAHSEPASALQSAQTPYQAPLRGERPPDGNNHLILCQKLSERYSRLAPDPRSLSQNARAAVASLPECSKHQW